MKLHTKMVAVRITPEAYANLVEVAAEEHSSVQVLCRRLLTAANARVEQDVRVEVLTRRFLKQLDAMSSRLTILEANYAAIELAKALPPL